MPNALMIMADELSTWGLGCYGAGNGRAGQRAITPNVDRLAAAGTRFDAAYTPSPICVPTRAAIATGRPLHEIGYWSSAEPYDGRHEGWGHRLQAAGHPVATVGKLHYRREDDPVGIDQQILPLHVVGGVGWHEALLRQPMGSFDLTDGLARDIGPGESSYTGYDRQIAEAACTWLDKAPSDPWCLFVSFVCPHYPLITPPEFFSLYDPKAMESDSEALPDHPILAEIGAFFDHDPYFTPETRGVARAAYMGLCSFVDAQIGAVLGTLKRSGQADDTLIIVTSDHGEMLGEKGFWTKSTMYESSARIPLVMAGPGVAREVREEPVSLLDLAPTICGATGADASGFPGIDLRGPAQPDRAVISEYHDGGCPVGMTMLRWDCWKYVHYAQGHPAQLFDLTSDPTEEHDLASTRPEMVAEARARLNAIIDPEEVDARAHADQARRIAELGGREAIAQAETFDYTPIGE